MMPGLRAGWPRGRGAGEEHGTCPRCGGVQVAGNVGFPLLGAPKFGYRLRTTEISVDVDARMCESCGLLEFLAKDPKPIRDARAVLLRVGKVG